MATCCCLRSLQFPFSSWPLWFGLQGEQLLNRFGGAESEPKKSQSGSVSWLSGSLSWAKAVPMPRRMPFPKMMTPRVTGGIGCRVQPSTYWLRTRILTRTVSASKSSVPSRPSDQASESPRARLARADPAQESTFVGNYQRVETQTVCSIRRSRVHPRGGGAGWVGGGSFSRTNPAQNPASFHSRTTPAQPHSPAQVLPPSIALGCPDTDTSRGPGAGDRYALPLALIGFLV